MQTYDANLSTVDTICLLIHVSILIHLLKLKWDYLRFLSEDLKCEKSMNLFVESTGNKISLLN